jgi:uncharacterized protein YceH (UPF0502 family)
MLGRMQLSPPQARVLGSLVEKELSTPDQYPLTLKSLTSACNQVSNRDPVVDYTESTVMSTLNALKEARLIRFVLPSHGRTAVRYRHVLDEAMGLDKRQCALLAVLLLRGPQTVGELRARSDRMAQFDSLDEVEHELRFLAAVAEPLAASLGRRPGQKEERWVSPLLATALREAPDSVSAEQHPVTRVVADAAADADVDGRGDGRTVTAAGADRTADIPPTVPVTGSEPLADLRTDIAALRSEVSALRRDLEALRTSLGG